MSVWEDVIESVTGGWEEAPESKPKYDPKAEQQKYLKQLAEETGFGETMLISAGRELSQLGVGAADLADMSLGYFGSDDAKKRRATRSLEQKEEAGLFKPLEEESPWATGLGTVLPYLATLPTGIASTGARASHIVPKLGQEFGKRLASETAIGAGIGGLHYGDTALGGAAGALGGGLLGKYMGDVLGGAQRKLVGDEPEIVDWALKNDLFVPPGMATGRRGLQQIDQAMKTHRTTTDKFGDMLKESNVAQNKLISKELGGGEAGTFTDSYMDDQRKRITGKMNVLAKNTTGEVNEDAALKATDILEEYKGASLEGTVPLILRNAENKLYDLAGGKNLDGSTYQNITRKLRAQASQQYGSPTGDRLLAKSLNDIAGIFDDSITPGLSGANKDAWKTARKEFALHSAIEEAKDHAGNVNASVLGRKFKSSDTINKLAKVDQLRKSQSGASLGTSAALGRMINVTQPAEQLGALSLLGSQAAGGVLPLLSDITTGLYLKGYPHRTGLLPGMSGERARRALERMSARAGTQIVGELGGTDNGDNFNSY